MKIIVKYPSADMPLAFAAVDLPNKELTGKRRAWSQWDILQMCDGILRRNNIMRLTPWRRDKTDKNFYVCTVRLEQK